MADPVPTAILIEDERQIRRFVRTALEGEGWSVHESDTLRQGLNDAGTRKPDLIILDLGLPDGNGMDFLKDLRAWSKVPVSVHLTPIECRLLGVLIANAGKVLTEDDPTQPRHLRTETAVGYRLVQNDER